MQKKTMKALNKLGLFLFLLAVLIGHIYCFYFLAFIVGLREWTTLIMGSFWTGVLMIALGIMGNDRARRNN